MSGISEATREQMEFAVEVLDAIIARDAAHEAYHDCRERGVIDAETQARFAAWLDKSDRALHQMELYRARYGAIR